MRRGRYQKLTWAIAAVFTLAACDNATTANDTFAPPVVAAQMTAPALAENTTTGLTPAITPQAPQPDHLYEERKGWTYYYVAAVSEEESKHGQAVGNVSGFQFLGKNAAGEYILASMNSEGSVSYKAKCSRACRIIDTDDGREVAFSPRSIIGAAFTDAFRGKLRIAAWAKDPIAQPVSQTADTSSATGADSDIQISPHPAYDDNTEQ